MSDLQNPVFHNEDKARKWLESHVWPDGPYCPHCGSVEATKLHGKAHRPGVYQCNGCRQQFTVTVGTLFERSKIPLSKWRPKGSSLDNYHFSLRLRFLPSGPAKSTGASPAPSQPLSRSHDCGTAEFPPPPSQRHEGMGEKVSQIK